MQINVDKRAGQMLTGVGAVVLALGLARFVSRDPDFLQVLVGMLSIVLGIAGLIFIIVGVVVYFTPDSLK